MGQAILVWRICQPVSIIYEGQARLLGYDPRTQTPTLKLLRPGEVRVGLAWYEEYHAKPAIASTEVVCLSIPAAEFSELLEQEPLSCNFPRSHGLNRSL